METGKRNTIIAGFTDEQAHRITGVSLPQLRYWARDFLVPSIAVGRGPMPTVRLYSFRDLACLKVLNALRNDAKVPLQRLREVKEKLSHLGDHVWSKTTLYVLDRKVILYNPETDTMEDAVSRQGVLQIPLAVVSSSVESEIRRLRQRPESDHGRISPKDGRIKRPVIAGTRVPVQAVRDLHEAGYSTAKIIHQYPSLTEADIRAALRYQKAA